MRLSVTVSEAPTNDQYLKTSTHPLAAYIGRLRLEVLCSPDTKQNVLISWHHLKELQCSAGCLLPESHFTLLNSFFSAFPFFKYFIGGVTFVKLLRHLYHDRINFVRW